MDVEGGLEFDGTAYAKSSEGLWVRAKWEQLRGEVVLSWQRRYRVIANGWASLDENGEIEIVRGWSESDAYRESWVPVHPVVSLDRPVVVEMGGQQLATMIEGLAKHWSLSAAYGYGDSLEELSEHFSQPELGRFVIVGARYVVVAGTGCFDGLGGMVLTILEGTESEVRVSLEAAPGRESFEHVFAGTMSFFADFLRNTVLIDGAEFDLAVVGTY